MREANDRSTLTISAVAFVCVLGGALLGMYLGRIMPQPHLSGDAKDVIKVSMAMVATLAALVLGLMTASAKSSLDDKESKLRDTAAQIVLLDRTMALYGAETREARDLLKRLVAARVKQIWPEEDASEVAPGAIGADSGIGSLQQKFLPFHHRMTLSVGFSRTRCRSAVTSPRRSGRRFSRSAVGFTGPFW